MNCNLGEFIIMDYLYILGVKLHKIKKPDIIKKIDLWLAGESFHYITTVNPEFTLAAQADREFKDILNNSDLAIPDGIGLKFAAWMFGTNIYRTTGADLTRDILQLAAEKDLKVYFFAWKNGLLSAEEIITKLEIRNWHVSRLRRQGAGRKLAERNREGTLNIEGHAIEKDGSDIDWEKFNEFNPDILLVGLGAPHQEKLIAKIKDMRGIESNPHRKPLPPPRRPACADRRTGNPPLTGEGIYRIKLAMGIGGTFDFLCGKIKRAPKIMRLFGLEWLWRLMQQPKKHRAKRIFNAVVIFPWRVFVWKLHAVFSKN